MAIIPSLNAYKPLASHRFMKSMASGGLARFILLESFVEAGRTYQAYQRGGFDEGRERITEEFTGAVFWLGGVKAFNAINDKIGKWILGLRTANFDLGSDRARNPLANFLHLETSTKSGKKFTESQIAKFKSAKLITSILMANAMIGFVVPKLNQRITKYYHRNDPKKAQEQLQAPNQYSQLLRPESMDKFIAKSGEDKKNINFGAGSPLLSLAFNLENNTTWQLLSTDIGTAGGRTISARNNDERREILFRDLTSIYFYMFNMNNLNNWLNRIEQKGNPSRLDPVSAEFATQYMEEYLKDKKTDKVNIEEFTKEFLGKNNDLPESLKAKMEGKNIRIINLDTFKEELKTIVPQSELKTFEQIADKMSELQPQVLGRSILTEGQARDILNGGHINNPEFLQEFFKNKFGNKFMDKYAFIAQKDLDSAKKDLVEYVKSIVETAKKTDTKEITQSMIRKASNHNLKMNAINWGAGFVTSALFLSTIIPKLQYLITKLRTGSNAFPGTKEYREQPQTQSQTQTKAEAQSK